MNTINSTFKDRLNEALKCRQMKPSELSRISGVNEGAISQYRKGMYKATQYNLEKLANALNVPIPWLMGANVATPFQFNIAQEENPELATLGRLAKKANNEQLKEIINYTKFILKNRTGDGIDEDL